MPTSMDSEKKHSTIDAVSKFIHDTLLAYDNNEYTVAIFLDLSKAFDAIDHKCSYRS